MDDITLPGWVWGTLAFIGLQILALIMGVVGNLSTPLVKAQAKAMRSGWSNWRSFQLAEKVYRIRLYKESPQLALARIAISLSMASTFMIFAAMLAIIVRMPNKIEIIKPMLGPSPILGLYTSVLTLALGCIFFLRAQAHYSLLANPRTHLTRIKRAIGKHGISWDDLTQRVDLWLARGPLDE